MVPLDLVRTVLNLPGDMTEFFSTPTPSFLQICDLFLNSFNIVVEHLHLYLQLLLRLARPLIGPQRVHQIPLLQQH